MDNRKFCKIIIFASIVGVLFIVVLLGSIYIHSNVEKRNKLIENLFRSSKYQYTRYDESGRIMSIGRASVFLPLEEDEFISYENPEKNKHYLISNFGVSEFHCSGNCYCEGKEESSKRRFVASSASRVVSYLIAASSSVLAFEIARKRFNRDCHSRLKNECDASKHSIRSDVDSCDEILQSSGFKEMEDKSKPKKTRYEYDESLFHPDGTRIDGTNFMDDYADYKDDEYYGDLSRTKTKRYLCKGNCIPNVYGVKHDLYWEYMEDTNFPDCHEFGCKRLELEAEVLVDTTGFETYPPSGEELMEHAENLFKTEDLHFFCTKNSYREVLTREEFGCNIPCADDDGGHECTYYWDYGKKDQFCEICEHSDIVITKQSRPLCCGHTHLLENEHVKCRMVGMWDGHTRTPDKWKELV